eukprot:TRINITY_DN50249_c0_g1_i1.p1 TRINITY_DN50249_c0_g1~~TRINITY_DN50249_c0_g1_i1.p1  ORF type:complete len:853 (+),score=178.97 TRINITY_DN50249_c0_g1_i1:109-2559(+)
MASDYGDDSFLDSEIEAAMWQLREMMAGQPVCRERVAALYKRWGSAESAIDHYFDPEEAAPEEPPAPRPGAGAAGAAAADRAEPVEVDDPTWELIKEQMGWKMGPNRNSSGPEAQSEGGGDAGDSGPAAADPGDPHAYEGLDDDWGPPDRYDHGDGGWDNRYPPPHHPGRGSPDHGGEEDWGRPRTPPSPAPAPSPPRRRWHGADPEAGAHADPGGCSGEESPVRGGPRALRRRRSSRSVWEQPIQVAVLWRGRQVVRSVDPDFSVRALKMIVEDITRVPASEQQLLLGIGRDARPFRSADHVVLRDDPDIKAQGGLCVLALDREMEPPEKHHGGHKDHMPERPKKPRRPPGPPAGTFVLRRQPKDHSCLFHSCAYVLGGGKETGADLRSRCADVILHNPRRFSDAFLGQPNAQYVARLRQPDYWGGAIELSILSFCFQVEICTLVAHGRRSTYIYGEGMGHKERVFLFYTGRHYDAFAQVPRDGATADEDITKFGSGDKEALHKAQALAQDLARQHRDERGRDDRQPHISDLHYPSHWTFWCTERVTGFHAEPVARDSVEFAAVMAALADTDGAQLGKGQDVKEAGTPYGRINPVEVFNLQSPILYHRYAERRLGVFKAVRDGRLPKHTLRVRQSIAAHLGPKGTALRPLLFNWDGTNEVRLFHGCPPAALQGILPIGLREGTSGHFGVGMYFADDPGKADQYAMGHTPGQFPELERMLYGKGGMRPGRRVYYMLLCRVTCGCYALTIDGKTIHGSGAALFADPAKRRLAPAGPSGEPYTSLVAGIGGYLKRYKEYVVFDKELVYPEYVIAYTRE